jgi:hypothetical protein
MAAKTALSVSISASIDAQVSTRKKPNTIRPGALPELSFSGRGERVETR